MADDKPESNREPPPLFDDDDDDDDLDDREQENEDLFASVSEPSPKSPVRDDDSTDDLFAEAQTEVPLDSPEKPVAAPVPTKDIMEPTPDKPNSDAVLTAASSSPATMKAETTSSTISAPIVSSTDHESKQLPESRSQEEIDEEEGGDQFNMEVTVTEPKKIGDGMNAYMAYRVNTKTTLPEFSKPEMSVYRRFSDFLGLHEKLVEHHQHDGVFIPPPPSKSVLGMTKIKMSKEEAVSNDFVEKRRAALERFLNRTAKHPVLRKDPYFIEFLTQEGDLPKATSTSALSGAGVMRLFNKVGDSFGKMTFKMDEADQLNLLRTYFCQLLPVDDDIQWSDELEWFEEKQQQVDMMESQLRKLHASIEALVQHRKELAQNTGAFAKSAAMLGNAEEHTALSRALSQLAEVEEKVDQLHMDQADNDFFVLAELVKDYVALIGAIKDVFHERVKIFKLWKEAEMNLNKKRETRAKLEVQRKLDKIPAVSQEITQLEDKVDKCQEEFEKISKNIRKEMLRFEKQRVKDFKTTIIHYLESLMNNQQQLIKHWDTFLPEAKAIA